MGSAILLSPNYFGTNESIISSEVSNVVPDVVDCSKFVHFNFVYYSHESSMDFTKKISDLLSNKRFSQLLKLLLDVYQGKSRSNGHINIFYVSKVYLFSDFHKKMMDDRENDMLRISPDFFQKKFFEVNLKKYDKKCSRIMQVQPDDSTLICFLEISNSITNDEILECLKLPMCSPPLQFSFEAKKVFYSPKTLIERVVENNLEKKYYGMKEKICESVLIGSDFGSGNARKGKEKFGKMLEDNFGSDKDVINIITNACKANKDMEECILFVAEESNDVEFYFPVDDLKKLKIPIKNEVRFIVKSNPNMSNEKLSVENVHKKIAKLPFSSNGNAIDFVKKEEDEVEKLYKEMNVKEDTIKMKNERINRLEGSRYVIHKNLSVIQEILFHLKKETNKRVLEVDKIKDYVSVIGKCVKDGNKLFMDKEFIKKYYFPRDDPYISSFLYFDGIANDDFLGTNVYPVISCSEDIVHLSLGLISSAKDIDTSKNSTFIAVSSWEYYPLQVFYHEIIGESLGEWLQDFGLEKKREMYMKYVLGEDE